MLLLCKPLSIASMAHVAFWHFCQILYVAIQFGLYLP